MDIMKDLTNKHVPSSKYTVHQLLTLLNIIDELKLEQTQQPLDVSSLILLVSSFLTMTPKSRLKPE